MANLQKHRRIVLYLALSLVLLLLALDRGAAYFHRPGDDSTAVVIYTTAWCPYCKSLRAYLDSRQVPYTDYDVEKTLAGGMGMWALHARGVPVSVIGPDIVYGYDLETIEVSLQKLGY